MASVVFLFKSTNYVIAIFDSSTEEVYLPRLNLGNKTYPESFYRDMAKHIFNVEAQYMLKAIELEEEEVSVYLVIASDLSEFKMPLSVQGIHYLPMTSLSKLENIPQEDKQIMEACLEIFNQVSVSNYE